MPGFSGICVHKRKARERPAQVRVSVHAGNLVIPGRHPGYRSMNPPYFPIQNLKIGRKPLSLQDLGAARACMCTLTCTCHG